MKPALALLLAASLVWSLEWEQKEETTIDKRMDHTAATAYCQSLEPKGSWRLPAAAELFSLSRTIPSEDDTDLPVGNYWSDTSYAVGDEQAWQVLLPYGDISPLAKSNALYVLCVRGEKAAPMPERFSKSDIGTLDKQWGIYWQPLTRRSALHAYDYSEAKAQCEGLESAGRRWRLPTIDELFSIVDYTLIRPAVDDAYFPFTVRKYYWSGTSAGGFANESYVVGFKIGTVARSSRENKSFIRCVSDQ